MDREITGNFEVTILASGGARDEDSARLIHSKRKGNGRATTAEERQWIVERIREALEGV